jgi:hypothetical protein
MYAFEGLQLPSPSWLPLTISAPALVAEGSHMLA